MESYKNPGTFQENEGCLTSSIMSALPRVSYPDVYGSQRTDTSGEAATLAGNI